jgi:16S rRNA (adenine1518-N6/adenine1519-N6)-dimethyltransferase
VVEAAFGQRRKMIRSALAALAGSVAAAEAAVVAAGLDPSSRAERLSVLDFVKLADRLGPAS